MLETAVASCPARKGLIAMMAIVLLPCGQVLAAPVRIEVTDETVSDVVRKAVDFLWSQQNEEGHWERTDAELKKGLAAHLAGARQKFLSDPKSDKSKVADHLAWTEKSWTANILRDRSGASALAALGLLHGGADVNDPRIIKALNWIARQQPTGTYALGLRCSLWAILDPEKTYKILKEESLTLQNGVWPFGTYTYTMRPQGNMNDKPTGDFSNNQYGILGVWAGAESGIEINHKYWQLVEHGYLASQNKDGGWRYAVAPPAKAGVNDESRLALTLGGVASLFLVWDKYYAQKGCDAPVNPDLVKALGRATDWTADYLDSKKNNAGLVNLNAYTLYALERAGVASGLKYFGDFDWYMRGADYAINRQSGRGSWSDHTEICGTAWTIMFLQFGRAPVVFNKLAYGKATDWNARPRDLANLTRLMAKNFESKFNWQIMPIDAPAKDLQDAPLMFISARSHISFNEKEIARLREYVQHGGTLLFSPAGGGGLANSLKPTLTAMFPGMELIPVPANAPIFAGQFKVAQPPRFVGIFNGIRWTVLISDVDLGCSWQQMQVARDGDVFRLAYNLYLYVSDSGQLRGRGHSYRLVDKGNRPTTTLAVGRLQWGSDIQSDPEPAAWAEADIALRNANVMGLDLRRTDLAQPLDPKAVPLLHLTGVGPLVLGEDARKNLQAYVNGGGLLLVDAAGGDEAFAKSFQEMADGLFGKDSLVPAANGLPFYADATDQGNVWYRHRNNLPRVRRPLEALVRKNGDDIAIIFLPYDLVSAMVGYPSAAPSGLTPDAAEKFLGALMKWRASAKPAN